MNEWRRRAASETWRGRGAFAWTPTGCVYSRENVTRGLLVAPQLGILGQVAVIIEHAMAYLELLLTRSGIPCIKAIAFARSSGLNLNSMTSMSGSSTDRAVLGLRPNR